MTADGVQQHYALQEEWQRLFASRARQWAISAGQVPADASREAIDRSVSEALHERGISRGASPSSVKKWRTGRFAPPPAEVLAALEGLLGTGSELGDLLASITRHAPGSDAGAGAGPDDALSDDGRPDAGPGPPGPSGHGDDRSPTDPDPDDLDDSAVVAGAGAYPAADPGAEDRRRLRRRVLAVSAVLTAIVVAVVLLIVDNRSSGPGAGQVSADREAAEGSCPVVVGSLPAELSSRPSAAEWKAAFAAAYREAGGRAEVGCPIAAVDRQEEDLLVQPLPGPVGDASGALAVLADRPSQHFYLNAALWASYQRDGPTEGDTVQSFGGLPEAVTPFPDGHVEVGLSTGVLLVAERADAPYFYIPRRFVTWWREHKDQLGLPMSNPYPGAGRQDAQRGHATVNRNVAGGEPQAHLAATGSTNLPAEVGQGGVIITGPDGTSWWIPAAGRRQWIIDVGTWSCLGGRSKTVVDDAYGPAVATLEYDGIAECEG